MRIALICSGNPKKLKYLAENRSEVKNILFPYWDEIHDTTLMNKEALLITLNDLKKNNEIEDFLFFFTGHGTTDNTSEKLELELFNTSTIDINDIIDSVYKVIKPKKLAIVLDACYSGEYKKVDFKKNIQLFSSSQYFQESYEFTEEDTKKYGKKIENSVFSHFFCESISELDGKITLHEIAPHIKTKLENHFGSESHKKQEPFLITYGEPSILVDKINAVKKDRFVINVSLENEKELLDSTLELEKSYNKKRAKIFISYSHEDEDWKDLIRKYFDASELFDMWDDRDIELGKDWENEIDKAAIEADIAVLLISVDFLNSSFIKNKEVPMLLNKGSNIKIIPILLSSAPWKHHNWLAKLQGYPKNFTPLDSFKVDNNILFKKCPNITKEINDFVAKIYKEYSSSLLNEEKMDNQVLVEEENKKKLLDIILDQEEHHKVDIKNIDIIKDNKKLGIITIKTVPIEVEGKVLNVSIYPVTFEEYDLFCEDMNFKNPDCYFYSEKRGEYPVVNISWDDADEYCKWLGNKLRKDVRLPKLYEWKEVAKKNNDYFIIGNNTFKKVGSKIGKLGISDMYGNIYQWCMDIVKKDYMNVAGSAFDDTIKDELTIMHLPYCSLPELGFRIVIEKD